MSQMAPFSDAAVAIDETNLPTTFISYYTYGAAIATALDLSLRDRSNGKITLDDFMRAMWIAHGKPGGPSPAIIAKPYTLKDARDRLADVSGDRKFADEFFDKYIEGRELPDYDKAVRACRARSAQAKPRRPPGWASDGSGLRRRTRRPPWRRATTTAPAGGGVTVPGLVNWGTPAVQRGARRSETSSPSADGKAVADDRGLAGRDPCAQAGRFDADRIQPSRHGGQDNALRSRKIRPWKW